jgi:hypothetical protein
MLIRAYGSSAGIMNHTVPLLRFLNLCQEKSARSRYRLLTIPHDKFKFLKNCQLTVLSIAR